MLERSLRIGGTDSRIPLLATNFDVEDAIFNNRTFAYDTFNRANSDSLGSLDSGQLWTEDLGDVDISGNQLIQGTTTESVATFPLGYQENLDAMFMFTCGSTNPVGQGLVFRYVDNDNYILIFHTHALLRIYKKLATTFTLLAGVSWPSALTVDELLVVQVKARGGIIEIKGEQLGTPANRAVTMARVIDDAWSSTYKSGLKAGFRFGNNNDNDHYDYVELHTW